MLALYEVHIGIRKVYITYVKLLLNDA